MVHAPYGLRFLIARPPEWLVLEWPSFQHGPDRSMVSSVRAHCIAPASKGPSKSIFSRVRWSDRKNAGRSATGCGDRGSVASNGRRGALTLLSVWETGVERASWCKERRDGG